MLWDVYERHGWATLIKSPECPEDLDDDEVSEQDLSAVRALLADSASSFNETADLRNANGAWHVWLAGGHNHPDPDVVNMFRAIVVEDPSVDPEPAS